ncbi:MAG: ferrous iron transporter B [Oscillospiraceae bacterium]|nr:ferrous iron transporter B [Oscillospiraceae bacterium]
MKECVIPMKVLLAGNPNVGKSTLFNALTGLHQHTGNWPGKTVGMAKGTVKNGAQSLELVDLPGTYSLCGKSEDERIAAACIDSGDADAIVVVCDASALERTLILALQIIQRAGNVILCINLMDEAKARGIRVDGKKLERLLGVPVVLTAAGSRKGLERLLEVIGHKPCLRSPEYFYEDPVAAAEELAAQCVCVQESDSQNWRRVLDRVLVSRRHGIPILLMLLFFIVWLTVWGANYPSQLLERLFDTIYELLKVWTVGLPGWLSGIFIDGMYATSARVIAVMLPPMAIFFPLFTILEDVGYLPRMALLLDRPMCRCGGCGKQALTLCMGLGCNAVGVTGCRIIDSPRERLLAILTNAMVPCNGRFPTLILLGSLFFPDVGAAFIVAACVVLGVLGAMAASGILSKTALRHEESAFVMEMPPFRRPRIGQVLVRSLLDRTLHIALRAIKVAAPAGAVLWILANTALLGGIAAFLDPLGRLLGMNGIILLAFCLSLPANELLIPVMLMAVTGGGNLQSVAGQSGQLLLSWGMTWQMAVCTMVFTLFHWPCSTTLMTVYKETGSKTKTAAAFALPTAVGVTLCAMLNLLL